MENATKWSEKNLRRKAVISMLMGTYSHSLDTKGRLIIPAKLREGLGEGFVITKSMDHCLAIYPNDEWEAFHEKMSKLPKVSSDVARRLQRFYFGSSTECEVDKQGRILVPNNLRTYANLQKDVTLVGVDDHVEVWDSAAWDAYNEEIDINDMAFDLSGIDL